MRFQSTFVVVGALLIAAPGIGNAAQRSDTIDALRQIATDVGRVWPARLVSRSCFLRLRIEVTRRDGFVPSVMKRWQQRWFER